MASEIRVNKINSQTGVGTITLSPTGVDISGITTVSTLKVGTGVTASEDGDIFFTGVCTATTFSGAHSGSGANLTALPAANITGTLPAISAANLTNIPAANVTGTLPAITAANLTNIPAANIVGVATAGFERTGGFAGGITEADFYRLHTSFQGNAYHIQSNWERHDSQTEDKLGTGMSESSGLFTFPSTGYYYVHFHVSGYRGAGSSIYNITSYIRTTTSGDTSSGTDYNHSANASMYSESGNSWFSNNATTIFKCSNTSNDKIFFGVQAEQYIYIKGQSDESFTYVVFIKLADL